MVGTRARRVNASYPCRMRWLFLFLAVALLGPLCDQIHVRTEVLDYPHPFFLGQAWWVPLLFGASGVFVVLGYRPFGSLAKKDEPPPSLAEVGLSAAMFVAAYAASGVFKDAPFVLAAAFAIVWLAVLAWKPSLDRLVYGLATAAGGALVETAIQSADGFHYRVPTHVALVPAWLPAIYLHVAVCGRAIARRWFQDASS